MTPQQDLLATLATVVFKFVIIGYLIESPSGKVILDSFAERADAREGVVVMHPGCCHAKSVPGG